MKQERAESRWAKMKRWADDYEAGRDEREWRVQERARVSARQQELEQHTTQQKNKLAGREEMIRASNPLLFVMMGAAALLGVGCSRYGLVSRGWALDLPGSLLLASFVGALNIFGLEVARLQRKFQRPLHISGWLVLVMTSVPVTCAAFALLGILLNGALDQRPTRIYRAQIQERRASYGGKGGTSYCLLLRDWKNPSVLIQISTERDIYEQAATSQTAIVETKPGFFGFEWVVRLSIR